MIGLISKKSSPCDIAQQVIADAAYMCSRTHGDAPDVSQHCNTIPMYVCILLSPLHGRLIMETSSSNLIIFGQVTIHGRTDLHFPYVSSHISYMLLELLKNSMRATVEKHGTGSMPPIRIVIADGEKNEDVSVIVWMYEWMYVCMDSRYLQYAMHLLFVTRYYFKWGFEVYSFYFSAVSYAHLR